MKVRYKMKTLDKKLEVVSRITLFLDDEPHTVHLGVCTWNSVVLDTNKWCIDIDGTRLSTRRYFTMRGIKAEYELENP